MRVSDLAKFINKQEQPTTDLAPIQLTAQRGPGAAKHPNKEKFPELYKKVQTGEMTGAAVQVELGITKTTYYNWVNEYSSRNPNKVTGLCVNLKAYPGAVDINDYERFLDLCRSLRKPEISETINTITEVHSASTLSMEYEWLCKHTELPTNETWSYGEVLALNCIMEKFFNYLSIVTEQLNSIAAKP